MQTGLDDSRGARPPDRPRPLPRHARQPAAHRPARQGRPARVRRELRAGRGPGLVVLAARRRACSTRATRSCGPPASPRAAPSSPRRPSAASAGSPIPPCSRGSRSTASGATTSSSRATASRSRARSSAPGGGRSARCRRTTGRGRRARASTATTQVYDRRNLGYRGPDFGLPPMPDQYTLLALQRRELAKRHRPPLFAEVDLISSHAPWTRIPRLIPWDEVGDGSIFDRIPAEESTQAALFGDAKRARSRLRAFDRVLAAHAVLVRAALRRRQPRARRPRRPSARDARHRRGRRATTCRSRSSPTTRR